MSVPAVISHLNTLTPEVNTKDPLKGKSGGWGHGENAILVALTCVEYILEKVHLQHMRGIQLLVKIIVSHNPGPEEPQDLLVLVV